MPSPYIVKNFVKDGYYHVFNRGVEKRKIFLEEADYWVFFRLLERYLCKPTRKDLSSKYKQNFTEAITLFAFIQMPNHYHLSLQQHAERAMPEFLHCLATSYTKYFNNKYKRVGPLFQSRYKAVPQRTTEQFLHLTRYIHLNALPIVRSSIHLSSYRFSSYPHYLGNVGISFIDDLSVFRTLQGTFGGRWDTRRIQYQHFVERDSKLIPDRTDLEGEAGATEVPLQPLA